jgi:hypothetical protein
MQQDFFFLIYGYHFAHYARIVRGNSVENPWAKPKRRKLRRAAPVQTGKDAVIVRYETREMYS